MPSTFSRNTERQGRIIARNWNVDIPRLGISLEIPAGLESIKLEGRVQVIAIHLPPGMYLGLKLRAEEGTPLRRSYARGKTIVNGSWRANRDTRRTRIAALRERVSRFRRAQGYVKFPIRHHTCCCEIQSRVIGSHA